MSGLSLPAHIEAVNAARAEVGEYFGCSPYSALISLLQAIERSYEIELRTVKPEDLASLQGKLAQTEALRRVLEGEAYTDGRA